MPNFSGAFLLMAYAAENFLKGIIVAKQLVVFTEPKLPAALKGHDLGRLRKDAGSTTGIPEYLLDLLTYCSTWQARYPVPLSVEEFWPMDEKGQPRAHGYPADAHLQIFTYCTALQAELDALAPHPQWPPPNE